jgi:hypothetical protein
MRTWSSVTWVNPISSSDKSFSEGLQALRRLSVVHTCIEREVLN